MRADWLAHCLRVFFHHQQRDKVTIRKQEAVQCAPASTPAFERKGGRRFFYIRAPAPLVYSVIFLMNDAASTIWMP